MSRTMLRGWREGCRCASIEVFEASALKAKRDIDELVYAAAVSIPEDSLVKERLLHAWKDICIGTIAPLT